MNLAQLERTLLAAAKTVPPGDHVPYAFERRVLARLRRGPATDQLVWWARSLWRAAAPGVAVTVLLALWVAGSGTASDPDRSVNADIETALFAVIDDATDLR